MAEKSQEPVKEINARNLDDLLDQVDSLPGRPVGDGSCQLVKKKRRNHFVALCEGECDTGECYTRIKGGPGDRIRIWCECM